MKGNNEVYGLAAKHELVYIMHDIWIFGLVQYNVIGGANLTVIIRINALSMNEAPALHTPDHLCICVRFPCAPLVAEPVGR